MLLAPYPPPLTTSNLSSVSVNFELFFISRVYEMIWGFPGGGSGKEPTCQCGRHRCRFSPWVGKIPWRRAWQATPVYFPGEPQGQEPGRLWSTGSQSWTLLKHTHPREMTPRLSFCVWLIWLTQCPQGLSMLSQMQKAHVFNNWIIFHYIYMPHFLNVFIHRWTLRLFSWLGYCN